jgi:general secretion pathway protein K
MTVRGRQGFALIAVLWVLVLASALAVELHGTVRTDQRAVANARAAARARWAARGALATLSERLRARLALSSAAGAFAATDPLLVPAVEYRLEGVDVRATVYDARARVQLNLASRADLHALFAAAGVEYGRAGALADRVVAWRSTHAPPALPPDSSGRRLRPLPGAFADVAELRAIDGVPPAEYERVAPYLTVAGDGRINVNTAPEPVLLTLPGIGREAARALVARRRAGPILSPYELLGAIPREWQFGAQERLPELNERVSYVPRDAEVRVTAKAHGSPITARIRAVAVFSGGKKAALVAVVER